MYEFKCIKCGRVFSNFSPLWYCENCMSDINNMTFSKLNKLIKSTKTIRLGESEMCKQTTQTASCKTKEEFEKAKNYDVMVRSSEILLSLDEHLEVFKNSSGVCVEYKNSEIKDGYFLKTEYGTGKDFESACDDYLKKIRGKKLVFNACTSYRKEVTVIG